MLKYFFKARFHKVNLCGIAAVNHWLLEWCRCGDSYINNVVGNTCHNGSQVFLKYSVASTIYIQYLTVSTGLIIFSFCFFCWALRYQTSAPPTPIGGILGRLSCFYEHETNTSHFGRFNHPPCIGHMRPGTRNCGRVRAHFVTET